MSCNVYPNLAFPIKIFTLHKHCVCYFHQVKHKIITHITDVAIPRVLDFIIYISDLLFTFHYFTIYNLTIILFKFQTDQVMNIKASNLAIFQKHFTCNSYALVICNGGDTDFSLCKARVYAWHCGDSVMVKALPKAMVKALPKALLKFRQVIVKLPRLVSA